MNSGFVFACIGVHLIFLNAIEMKKISFLSLLILTFWVHANVNGQTLGSPAPTATMAVQISQVLDLAVTTGSSLTFNFNTIALIDAGITQTNAATLTYKSNQPWYINIAANTANFSGTSPTPMPASVITYRLTGGPTFTPLSTTAASLTGTTGAKNARGTGTVGVDFKLNPGYIYAPATDYSMTITYTISNL
jgi:spore coat protein U-like protein